MGRQRGRQVPEAVGNESGSEGCLPRKPDRRATAQGPSSEKQGGNEAARGWRECALLAQTKEQKKGMLVRTSSHSRQGGRQLLALKRGKVQIDVRRAHQADYCRRGRRTLGYEEHTTGVERLLEHDPDADEVYNDDEEMDYLSDILDGEMSWAGDEGHDDTEVLLEPTAEDEESVLPNPRRRLKRKTAAADLNPDRHEAMMLKTQLTTRGLEKRKGKELKWSEIPPEVHEKFREAEVVQWEEHLSFDALEPLTIDESNRVRQEVPPERILRSRWAYKDKNWSRRREGEEVPWKCKSRLVIAGHTDPDLTDESMHLSTDAPTLRADWRACYSGPPTDFKKETHGHLPQGTFDAPS